MTTIVTRNLTIYFFEGWAQTSLEGPDQGFARSQNLKPSTFREGRGLQVKRKEAPCFYSSYQKRRSHPILAGSGLVRLSVMGN
jgi:hypothetical protein